MSRSPRVLVVEDDVDIAGVLRRSLDKEGYDVRIASDGEAALEESTVFEPDAVVLDLGLPKLDGVEVCRRLRQDGDVPILMLTARDALESRVEGLDSGADDYLVKPFALREVVARLRALTRRHVPDRKAQLRAGKLLLDTAAHTLTVDGEEVDLTAKEFAILEYFLLNQGRLLTRSQILEHAWDYDFDGGRNLVEVYMGRLRRKLADAGVRDPFVTIRGSGYRYTADES